MMHWLLADYHWVIPLMAVLIIVPGAMFANADGDSDNYEQH